MARAVGGGATAAAAAGGDGGGGAGRPPPEGIIGQAGSRVGMTPARAPSCYICGRRQLAAVRSSCAFRAALPASRTNRRCGRCVYGGECARHERRLSRVRDIKFLEGGTIRASRRPRCHGAAQAWRARSEVPDASAGVVRGVCAPWWRHHQLRRARKVLARRGLVGASASHRRSRRLARWAASAELSGF